MSESIKWFLVFSSLEKAEINIPDNRAVVVEVEDKKLCLTRTGSSYFAFDDRCPHQGSPLNKGKCENGHFICPWHRYAFDLETGKEKTGLEDPMKVYKTKIENEKLYIGITEKKQWWQFWL